MRFFVSRAVVSLLALALLTGGVAAQSKKKKRTKAAKATTSKTTKTTPAKTAPTTYTGDPIPPPQLPEQGDGVRRITPAEAREALEKGTAIIVDVRNDLFYQTGHIKGAILIPSYEIGAHLKELPRDKMIITYCS